MNLEAELISNKMCFKSGMKNIERSCCTYKHKYKDNELPNVNEVLSNLYTVSYSPGVVDPLYLKGTFCNFRPS